MSGPKTLKKGDILFRENDPSEAMYVIKSGKIAITKAKGMSEITLAELGPGDMLGEMAFFDNKPRSAGAKAVQDSVVIELPFAALNAQFKTFPEWLKAVVRTVNNHLRNANMKIKNLEKSSEEDTLFFTPHLVSRLGAILGLVAARYGEKSPDTPGHTLVPPNRLRNYTIQVFQAPTAKMTKFQEVLQGLGHFKIEEIGEGRQKLTLFNTDFLLGFVDWYNDWIFKSEDKKVTIEEKEMKALRALIFYGKKVEPDAKGMVKVNLTAMQNESMKDLGYLFSTDDVNSFSEKKLTTEKMQGEGGLFVSFNRQEIETLCPYWEIVHATRAVTR
ncbi:MAG TPA: cyclic nucleotide-binding domain-containing protein [Bdellovibrionales bacterium]|jgi:CRP-like cAMP-binding protein|nr:cyclic nucleotide-binding domain-containing protein [Bdellovibrionales bacterium]